MHRRVGKPLADSMTIHPTNVDSPTQPRFVRTDSHTVQMGTGSPQKPARPVPTELSGLEPTQAGSPASRAPLSRADLTQCTAVHSWGCRVCPHGVRASWASDACAGDKVKSGTGSRERPVRTP